jgi:penicillin-binding protein 2
MARVSLHDRHLELQVYKNRVVIAAAFCLLAVLVLVVRLFILQIVDHDIFSTLSQSNRMRLTAVAPNRGLIYDRNGIVLAENRPSYQLELVPDGVKDIDATLAQLRQLVRIEESDIQRFRKELKRDRGFEAIPLRFNLSEGEVAHFAVNRHRFPGVDIKGVLSRYYPFGAMTAPVLGYVSRIDEDDLDKLDEGNYRATTHIGKVGIEQYYENILHGTAGYKQVEVNVEGREIHVVEEKDPVPGSDLYLSIDIRLQTIAETALGENSGSVVAIEPATGAVLVFVSKPSYDPALFVNGISTEAFTALQQDPGRPLFNRALHGQYPPGSTVKPLFGLAALERGVLNENFQIGCSGSYQLPRDKRRYRDWKKHGHGPGIDLEEAVIESCDVFFYDLAYRSGIDAMAEYVRQFGFGRPTGIDIVGEKFGLLPTTEWKKKRFGEKWYAGESLSAGIGQGYTLTTPLQLAYMTSIMAANGAAWRPHVLEAIRQSGYTPPPAGASARVDATLRQAAADTGAQPVSQANTAAQAVVDDQDPRLRKIAPVLQHTVPVVHQSHWDYIRNAMIGVVHSPKGTARATGLKAPYHIAGKTGTAQVISIKQNEEYDEEKISKQHRDHALFIAYAPAEKPEIAMAILVENGGHGASAAAPIARKIMDQYLIARIH